MNDTVAAQGHLPECAVESGIDHDVDGCTVVWRNGSCICPELRAVEARVQEEYESMLRANRSVVRYYADEVGVTAEVRAAALDAACEAVGNARMRDVRDGLIAVAAIAALKEKP